MTITMERILSYLPLALAALLYSQNVSADRGTVRADGLFIVQGAALDRAIVRVMPSGAKAYSLPMGTERFVLDLPVNDTYLISFERLGCPTKEVYFDTSVPVERHTEDFEFRFKVTLEHMEKERMFTYDGPVGFVRYMHGLKDFGYETQYVMKVNQDLKERMEEYKESGVDPKVIMVPKVALVVDRKRDGSTTETRPMNAMATTGDVAPIVSEVPRMVHRLRTSDATVKEPEVEQMKVDRGDFLPIVISAAIKELPLEPAILDVPTLTTPKKAVADTLAKEPVSDITPSLIQREEELIVEPRTVSKVVRLTHANGQVEEFRKVMHSYGDTFFFHNGQSITSDRYKDLSAQR